MVWVSVCLGKLSLQSVISADKQFILQVIADLGLLVIWDMEQGPFHFM